MILCTKVKQLLSDFILYVHSVASLLLASVIQLPQHFYHFSTSFRLSDKLVTSNVKIDSGNCFWSIYGSTPKVNK